jgi:hypothetical protein
MNKYLIVIILLLACCCTKVAKKNISKDITINKIYNEEYVKSITFFPLELTQHFPPKASDEFVHYCTDINLSGRLQEQYDCSMFVIKEINKNESNFILSKFKFLKIYSATDSDPLLVFSYLENEEIKKENIEIAGKTIEESRKIANFNLLKENQLPIPLFDCFATQTSNTFSGLNESYKIMIIDAKPGIFIDISKLKINKYLPKKWTHGYSKGIALSKKENKIIYWIVVW